MEKIKKYLLLNILLVLVSFNVVGQGIQRSGWTTTANPAIARAALGVDGGSGSFLNVTASNSLTIGTGAVAVTWVAGPTGVVADSTNRAAAYIGSNITGLISMTLGTSNITSWSQIGGNTFGSLVVTNASGSRVIITDNAISVFDNTTVPVSSFGFTNGQLSVGAPDGGSHALGDSVSFSTANGGILFRTESPYVIGFRDAGDVVRASIDPADGSGRFGNLYASNSVVLNSPKFTNSGSFTAFSLWDQNLEVYKDFDFNDNVLTTTSDISAGDFIGGGSQLTGISVSLAGLPSAVITNNHSGVTFRNVFATSRGEGSVSLTPPVETAGQHGSSIKFDTLVDGGFAQTDTIEANLGDFRFNANDVSGAGFIYAKGTYLTDIATNSLSTAAHLFYAPGTNSVYINSGAMISRTTAGAATGTTETTSNDIMFDSFDFDSAAEEGVGFWWTPPTRYDGGTVTVKFHWTAASGTGTAKWDIAGRAFADDAAIDTALGTEQGVTDTLITALDMHITAETSALTIAGTPEAGRPTYFQITRDIADTLNADAKLLGCTITYNQQ